MRQIIALSGALLLAACQMVPKTAAPPAAPPPPPKAEQVPDKTLPTDTARNRVALLIPLSGPNAAVGQSIANATTMALLDTKTERLRVTTYDTGTGAAAAARRAVMEGNKLILGPLTAEEVKDVAPVARAARVPVIGYSNDASVAGNGVYLLGYAPSQSISRVVSFARTKGAKNFAALVPKGVYGERAGTAFLSAVKAAGGTAVGMETFDRSPASVTAAVKRLGARSSYDALLIADLARIAVQIAPQIRSDGSPSARILGTELWNTETNLNASPALRGAWFASVSDGLYRTLASKYRTSYGVTPYRLASLGYDSVLLTVRIAQSWQPGSDFPVARLTDPDGFAGIDGAFRFDGDSLAQRSLEVQEVDADGITVVDPAPRGFGK
ncbi:MAG: penicillin-binding protein activator [Sphingobium sp.]|nr:penicillin-binding protein activator [Sphingobium sp.]